MLDGRCDHCDSEAAWTWTRSEKDIKAIRRKVRGNWTPVLPVAQRCDAHVPRAFPELFGKYTRKEAQ